MADRSFTFAGMVIREDPNLRPDEVRFRHPDNRTDVFILPDQTPYTAAPAASDEETGQ